MPSTQLRTLSRLWSLTWRKKMVTWEGGILGFSDCCGRWLRLLFSVLKAVLIVHSTSKKMAVEFVFCVLGLLTMSG